MCKVYNTIGSLSYIKSHLANNGINDFRSVRELLDFKNSYGQLRKEIFLRHKKGIEEEKIGLEMQLQNLSDSIDVESNRVEGQVRNEINGLIEKIEFLTKQSGSGYIHKLLCPIKKLYYKAKAGALERNINLRVVKAVKLLMNMRNDIAGRYQFITTYFEEAVEKSSAAEMNDLERINRVVAGLDPFIYGAMGENKVVSVLENLSDDYCLINDFSVSFSPAIYNKNQQDYIRSIQVDHLLIGPSGVFIIETKNWSERTIKESALRSPADQIQRSSNTIFRLLNSESIKNQVTVNNYHWGTRDVPLRNLVVMTNAQLKCEYPFVKVLSLSELLGYINYFSPVFTRAETKSITEFFLQVNNLKTVSMGLNYSAYRYFNRTIKRHWRFRY